MSCKILDLQECAAMLKVAESTARELAAEGRLPGAKIGRRWVFVEEDVLSYLSEIIQLQTAERATATLRRKELTEKIKVNLHSSLETRRKKPLADLSRYLLCDQPKS
jgi:excisionase family DNA binding protein